MYTSVELTPQANGSKKRSCHKAPPDPKPSEVLGKLVAQLASGKAEEAASDRAVLVGKAFIFYGEFIRRGILLAPNFDQRTDADVLAVADNVQTVINRLVDVLEILDCC